MLQLMADSSLQLATADSPATRAGEWVKRGRQLNGVEDSASSSHGRSHHGDCRLKLSASAQAPPANGADAGAALRPVRESRVPRT